MMNQIAHASDGTALRYDVRDGAGASAPRVALVHSLGLDRHVWEAVADRLAERACVLTYDCRGHGASDKPAGPYALSMFADDLACVLDAAGWEHTNLAGCSMGGNVALAFTVANADRVTALGLVDTTAYYGDDAPARWDERAQRAREDGLASMIGFQETRWFSDDFRAERADVVARARDAFLANDVEAYAATCAMLGRFDLRGELSGIGVPVAIVVGEQDYATPLPMAQALHEAIAGSTLQVLPNARHLTTIEKPDVIAATLAALIERATGG